MNSIVRDVGIGVVVAVLTAYVIRTFPALQKMVVGSCNCPGAAPAGQAAGNAAVTSGGSGAAVSPQPILVGNAGPWSPAVGIGGPVSVPLSGVPDPVNWFSDYEAGRGFYDSTGAG